MQIHSAQDPSHRIQKQAQLLIHAGTCRHTLSSLGPRELNEDALTPLEVHADNTHAAFSDREN